jgi:hypothetical protein
MKTSIKSRNARANVLGIFVRKLQEHYYSGHRSYHAIQSQIVTDNTGVMVHVESGFLGHINDAQPYALMTNIGPGDELDFPLS